MGEEPSGHLGASGSSCGASLQAFLGSPVPSPPLHRTCDQFQERALLMPEN